MKTLLIRFVVAACGVIGAAQSATACSCMMPGPPCQAYFEADAVFVGTVKSVTDREMNDPSFERLFEQRVARMTVENASRGVQGTEVDVWTSGHGASCGFDFKAGERYVVYAYRRPDGALTTSTCSRTRLASDREAADDLRYLAVVPVSGRGAQINGVVKHWEPDTSGTGRGNIQHGPVPDVQVLVRGAAGVFTGMSREDGHYSIDGVPPGAYEFDVLPPPTFGTRGLQRKFEIKDARACRVEDVSLHYNGRIAGRVVGDDDRPVAGVGVQIVPVGSPELLVSREGVMTDLNGLFELTDVAPGRYTVGVELRPGWEPKVLYGRTAFADAIEVGAGNRVEAGTLHLPRAAARYELKGIAVFEDGTPARDAFVAMRAGSLQVSNPVRTAADGSFTLAVFEGQTYTVASHFDFPGSNPFRQARGQTVLRISGEPAHIRLVLLVR